MYEYFDVLYQILIKGFFHKCIKVKLGIFVPESYVSKTFVVTIIIIINVHNGIIVDSGFTMINNGEIYNVIDYLAGGYLDFSDVIGF